MRRFILMLTVAALMVAIMATGAIPAQAKAVCKVYDQAEWYMLTGQDSTYGGTWCTRH
ncbi:MAG: hypothetical protein QOI57_694 [Rubrobacteraceae bacterium]|jgi:hypothetical protein|nr:hypothetical protein [Rubrobacteraceae bacterium]